LLSYCYFGFVCFVSPCVGRIACLSVLGVFLDVVFGGRVGCLVTLGVFVVFFALLYPTAKKTKKKTFGVFFKLLFLL